MMTYADYMMILSPPENIKDIIKTYKRRAVSIIGHYESRYAIPQITVNDRLTRQKPFLTEPAILVMGEKLKNLPPVVLCMDGIDAFSHGTEHKTIYADIRSTEASKTWFKELKKIINNRSFIKPHITIHENISIEAYKRLWPHLKEVRLVEPFRVDKLTVLRRDTFDHRARWEVFAELPFEGKILYQDGPARHPAKQRLTKNTVNSQQISLF